MLSNYRAVPSVYNSRVDEAVHRSDRKNALPLKLSKNCNVDVIFSLDV